MANTAPTQDIDVLKYQDSLKAFLRTFPQFTDFDFEGSNFSVLVRLLAYNAYNMAQYGNMVGNEAFLDTSILRQSLISHATDLNYLPRSRISSYSYLEVEIYPTDTPTSIIMPRYYRFKTTDTTGKIVYFITDQEYIVSADDDGRYIFKDVIVYQGEIINEYLTMDGVKKEGKYVTYETPIIISSSDIDTSSLEVFVGINKSDVSPVRYTYTKTLSETSSTSKTFFIRGIYDDQYAIEFGDGTFGEPVDNGNFINIRYRNTQGTITSGNYTFTKTGNIQNYSKIIVNSASRVEGGFERETAQEIKTNAPKYFQTQDRAVTSQDYETIIKSNFPNIQQVFVYGGEEVQQYGKIIIVLKPYGTQGSVINTVKNQIIALLKTKNIVPEPIIVDPDYYYIGVNAVVSYRRDDTQLTEDQLKTNIINSLINLNNTDLSSFNVTIYQSQINNIIDSSDSSIIGNDVELDIRRRWQPQLNQSQILSFTINNPLRVSLDGEFQNANDYIVTTSVFEVYSNNILNKVIIQDDGAGRLFYYNVNDPTRKIKIDQSIGTIDYETGEIQLSANIYSYTNFIEFIMKLRNKSIKLIHESFAIIDSRDISLTLTNT